LIADLATNKAKRETFAKLADHLTTLADEVERAMVAREIEEDDNDHRNDEERQGSQRNANWSNWQKRWIWTRS
jgi:hypothetical protein